jgi:hypothetical protein
VGRKVAHKVCCCLAGRPTLYQWGPSFDMGYSERVQQQLHHEDGVGSGRCDNSERGLYGLFHVMTFKVLKPVNKATGQEDIVDLDSGLYLAWMMIPASLNGEAQSTFASPSVSSRGSCEISNFSSMITLSRVARLKIEVLLHAIGQVKVACRSKPIATARWSDACPLCIAECPSSILHSSRYAGSDDSSGTLVSQNTVFCGVSKRATVC